MGNLYGKNLAGIFDKMYQGLIDYEAEFAFYADICKSLHAETILEIACGSGNLAKQFTANFEGYLGLDVSKAMLDLARKKNPSCNFLQADMRNIRLLKMYQAALITGRSTSYLMSNSDLKKTFLSAHKLLRAPALFVFDCIDAEKFIPHIAENPQVTHRSVVGGRAYSRNTEWYVESDAAKNLIRWKSIYFESVNGKKLELGSDDTIFRVFTKKEICRLLEKNGFRILEIKNRKTYAFDTFVVIAQKK